MSAPKPRPKSEWTWASSLLVVVWLAITGTLVYFAQQLAGEREFAGLNDAAREALALQSAALDGVFEKYRLLPAILAERQDVISIARGRTGDTSTSDAQNALHLIAAQSGALDIGVLDNDLVPVASARGLLPTDLSTHAGFSGALNQRRLGRIETQLSDGQQAYIFARQLRHNDEPIGSVAVVVPFATIGRAWSLSRHPIFVTDSRGQVFLANRETWVGKRWKPPSGTDPSGQADQALSIYDQWEPSRVRGPGNIEYIEAARTIPLLNWTLHALVDAKSITAVRLQAGLSTLLAVVIITLSALYIRRRRQHQRAQLRKDRANAIRLERRVRDRTKELSAANTALSHEVGERRAAEERLRATQNELIHSAKLATIGQMAAAMSHEYNQPLGAMRTYADNANKFLERNDTAKAGKALGRISELVDRMARLSRMLLTFSRKPETELRDVPIQTVLDEALMLLRPRLKTTGVDIETQIAPDTIAHTGRTRIGQVLVNLVNNAIDASTGKGAQIGMPPKIRITAQKQQDHIIIEVTDNGPGFPPEVRENLFTPFYTTKPDGHGLGLVIVESIMRDVDGRVEALDAPEGGARLRLTLPAAQISDSAREILHEAVG